MRAEPVLRGLRLLMLGVAAAFTTGAAWAKAPQKPAASTTVSYSLGPKAMVQTLYPDASWLPAPYAAGYPDLAATIEKFTLQSLQRDGVKGAKVRVTFEPAGDQAEVRIRIHPANAVTRRYAQVHPAFMDATHGQAALKAVKACQATPGCWDPQPKAGQPWAPFLPLGLPMATQKTVPFFDYPPIPALTGQDYLHNFTLCRWGRVMGAAGAKNPLAYETLVDSRPIAAPGAGIESLMPDPATWFNRASPGADYLTPMLQLLTQPADDKATITRPVATFGAAPRRALAAMVGATSLKVLDVGESALGGQARKTPWIATNHPDVTSYNCCPGDSFAGCAGSAKEPASFSLVADEQTDFIAACWMQAMAATNPPSAADAKARCETTWKTSPDASARQTLCVQAKLDNNNPAARCTSYEQAWNYCAAHDANACASLDCSYDSSQVKLALPPPAKRPYGWQDTCQGKF